MKDFHHLFEISMTTILQGNQATRIETSGIDSNHFLRTFSIGCRLSVTTYSPKKIINHEIMINSLTGKLSIIKVGAIKRQLSMAQLNYDGVVLDQ